MADSNTSIIFEAGQLKRIRRSGWLLAGIENPETVAEHSYRAALIGFLLAEKMGLDSGKVMKMLLFHDLPEARIGDHNKLQARYVDLGDAEMKAAEEQAKLMGEFGAGYLELLKEFNEGQSSEAVLAQDVDKLECAIQAKEYLDIGYSRCEDWLNNIGKGLKTKECKEIFAELRKGNSYTWWNGLKKL
ncbi:MAG: HD domain-containing protein [Candidatus Diapherotrites archaeon]